MFVLEMMTMKKILRRLGYIRSQSGAAAIEGALILPFVFLLFMGLQDFTALVSFNRKIIATSAMMSDTIAQYPNTITRQTITDIFNAVGLIMQPTPDTLVRVNVFGYTIKNGAPALNWQVNNANGPPCPAPDTTNFPALMTTGNDLVVSVSCFNFTPYFANVVGGGSMLLHQTIAARPRASTTLNCVTVSGGNTLCSS